MINLRAVNFRAGQEARAAEDRGGHVEKIETRQLAGDVKVRFEESADGADVFPVALKDGGKDAAILDGLGDDVFAEIGELVVEEALDHLAVENVDAHRGEEKLAIAFDAEPFVP